MADQELDDRWILGMRHIGVGSIAREQFRITIRFGNDRILAIEGAATLGAASPNSPRMDLWDEAAVPDRDLQELVVQQVVSAVVFKTGAFRLVLSAGAFVRVPLDAHYEPWQLTDPDGSMFVSMPGGGIARLPRSS